MNIPPNPAGHYNFLRYAKRKNAEDARRLEASRARLKEAKNKKAMAIKEARDAINEPADMANAIYRQQPISTQPALRKRRA